MQVIKSLIFFVFLVPMSLQSFCLPLPPHRVTVGPEAYFLDRRKDGGSNERAIMGGARLNYDRILPNSYYWGVEALVGAGTAEGHSGGGTSLKSRMKDIEFEGRVGYTWYVMPNEPITITPFVGYGRYIHTNRFVEPVFFPIRFRHTYQFFLGGFLLEALICENIQIGAHIRAKYSVHPRSQVTNDPFNEDLVMQVENKTQYSMDFPITYATCYNRFILRLQLSPFYRYRHLGGREGIYDFFDTRFYNYGMRFGLMLDF